MPRTALRTTALRTLSAALLAGTALIGPAVAQDTPPAPSSTPPATGGLVLPGTVNSSGGAAAGTIATPTQQRPAAAQGAAQGATQGAAPAPRPAAQQPGVPAGPSIGAIAGGGQRPAGAAPQPSPPATPAKIGNIKGEWNLQPRVYSDGTFQMCTVSAAFDTGLELVFMKNPEKRLNIVLGVPGSRMQPGARLPMKVSVDGTLSRDQVGMISQPDAMVIAMGEDAEFQKAVGSGNVLSLMGPGDEAKFKLSGTTKAMTDLDNCVNQALAGTLKMPTPPEMIPRALAQLLVQAGLKDARALPVDRMPPDQRPGDAAWQLGEVTGSIRGIPVPGSAGDVTKVSENYLGRLKETCGATYQEQVGKGEALKNFALRTANVTCAVAEPAVAVSLVFQLVPGPEVEGEGGKKERIQLLNIFTHEGPVAARKVAEDASASIAKVLREIDAKAPAPGAAPAAAPAAAKKP